jgi:hypothetical protein
MPENSSPLSRLTLREILRYCTDRESPYFEYAWREFNRRYEKFIYTNIKRRCSAWKSNRLKPQLDETVQDIFAKIITDLCTHEFKALREFRGSENDEDHERMFRGWLAMICHNQCSRELRKFWWRTIQNQEPDAPPEVSLALDSDMAWALYNDVVSVLRTSAKGPMRERDIHIFLQSTIAGFSEAVIRAPEYMKKNLGDRVVHLAVYRMREILRNWKDLFF